MRKLMREQVVDYQTWTDIREQELAKILPVKAARRMHLGPALTFLFENRETVRWQVQEMMRVERIVREKDIAHEIETYNELIGGEGEIGSCLLVEIDDPAERARKLREWLALPGHLYAEIEGGERVRPIVDARQVGEDRLSSVQYLKFPVRGQTPVAIGCDMPEYSFRVELSADQRAALGSDLSA